MFTFLGGGGGLLAAFSLIPCIAVFCLLPSSASSRPYNAVCVCVCVCVRVRVCVCVCARVRACVQSLADVHSVNAITKL